MTMQLDDVTLAALIAQGTGDILKGVRTGRLLRDRVLGSAGDEIAQDWMARVLARHRPDDAVLSEEAPDDRDRIGRSRVWIVDPLDGTREFSTGRMDWAVHVALCVDGVPVAAAVGMPDAGRVWHTGDVKYVAGPLSRTIVVSRNRPPAIARTVADALGYELRPMGSAGAKAMSVVLGDADAYIHAGGQYQWDSAAPVGVALAAGLHCSRLDGSPLLYNAPDIYLPDLVICRPEIADEVLSAIAAA